MNFLKGSRLLG